MNLKIVRHDADHLVLENTSYIGMIGCLAMLSMLVFFMCVSVVVPVKPEEAPVVFLSLGIIFLLAVFAYSMPFFEQCDIRRADRKIMIRRKRLLSTSQTVLAFGDIKGITVNTGDFNLELQLANERKIKFPLVGFIRTMATSFVDNVDAVHNESDEFADLVRDSLGLREATAGRVAPTRWDGQTDTATSATRDHSSTPMAAHSRTAPLLEKLPGAKCAMKIIRNDEEALVIQNRELDVPILIGILALVR